MISKKTLRLGRPLTARAVARRAGSLEQFGWNARDWFHELSQHSTRAQLREAVKIRPPSLAEKFTDGHVADAFLAANVEYLCHRAKIQPPSWVRDPVFVLDAPWFSIPSRRLRAHLLLDTPVEFRNRNLFTTPEVQVTVRRGRPRVSTEQKRVKARLRQSRYRARKGQAG
jgi:hypothetical protein